jgi:hypothetical protein
MMGINVDRTIALVFALGGAMAGAAGVLFGLGIGFVSSLLGVAGGEVIIPTLVFAYATFKAFAVLFGERLQDIRAARKRDHTIVCGLGRRGAVSHQRENLPLTFREVLQGSPGRTGGPGRVDGARGSGRPAASGARWGKKTVRSPRCRTAELTKEPDDKSGAVRNPAAT